MVTPMAIAMKQMRKAQCSATKTAQKSRVSHNVVNATTLIRKGIVLCFMKLVI